MKVNTVGPCLVRFCEVRIWIARVLKNTPDLHSAYYGFLAFSDRLYYSGTCVVRFYIVWFCIVHTFFWILRAHYARTYCIIEFKISGWIWNWIPFIFSVIIFRMGYFPFNMVRTPFGQKWLHWWKWRRLVDTGIQNDTCDSWAFHNLVNSEWKKLKQTGLLLWKIF